MGSSRRPLVALLSSLPAALAAQSAFWKTAVLDETTTEPEAVRDAFWKAAVLDQTTAAPDAPALTMIHIPKNAGTTIEEVGHAHGYNWGRWTHVPSWHSELWGHTSSNNWRFTTAKDKRDSGAVPYGCSPCSPWHVPPASYQRELGFNPYNPLTNETFCVVRHPYARAISEILYYQGLLRNVSKSTCAADTINGLVNGALDSVQDFLLGFSSWDGALDARNLDGRAMADCHWLPQAAYANGPGVPACQHVLHVESLEADWAQLMQGRAGAIATTELSKFKVNESPCNVTVGVLSPATRDRLAQLYAADLAAFNYSRELIDDEPGGGGGGEVLLDGGGAHLTREQLEALRRQRELGLVVVRESDEVMIYA